MAITVPKLPLCLANRGEEGERVVTPPSFARFECRRRGYIFVVASDVHFPEKECIDYFALACTMNFMKRVFFLGGGEASEMLSGYPMLLNKFGVFSRGIRRVCASVCV